MKPIMGHQISKQLTEALGLPPMTRGFTLRCYTGQAVTVECEYYPHGSFEPALAQYHLVPNADATITPRLDFDAMMRDRTERAHREFMRRTSCLPAGRDLRPTTEQIARFHCPSIGFVD